MRWYIGRTIKAVREAGVVDADFLNRVGESINKKFRLVNCHIEKSKSSLYVSVPDDGLKAVNLASAYMGRIAYWSSHTEEEIDNAVRNVFESEAHIESFASQLHSIADNLAILIYLAFPYLQEKINYQSQVSIYRVCDSLAPQHGALRSEVDCLLNMPEFSYLVAFTNLGKHQSLVERNFHCNFDTDEEHPHQVVFKEFVYKQERFRTLKSFEFTDSYGKKIRTQYLRIGSALEQALNYG